MSVKVSALTNLTGGVSPTDTVYVVRSGASYKGTVGELLSKHLKVVAGFTGYLIIPASGNTNSSIVQADDILIGKGAFHNGEYVMMRALQDSPTLDAHFAVAVRGEE